MSIIKPSKIKGTLKAPPSKSMMQRYVALATLARGTTRIFSPSFCDDCLASLQAARGLGALVEESPDAIRITGYASSPQQSISCGESGTSIRILSAVAATFPAPIELTGSGTLKNRPMEMLEEPLMQLGVSCTTTEGKLPIRITGPMQGGAVRLDGSVTSQFLSGLLIALPTVSGNSTISVSNLKSRPYVSMTLDAVKTFGGKIVDEGEMFRIQGETHYTPQDVTVEGDWSGASFLLVAGAIAGNITVTGLRNDSAQADRAILEALRCCGVQVNIGDTSCTVTQAPLKAFSFDATDCPDLFPPLCALASACSGVSHIRGASRLVHKESSRGLVLQKELASLGITVDIDDDIVSIHGGAVRGGVIDSHGDHRIAMAGAIAALRADAPVEIVGASAVQKSFPSFFEDLARCTYE